MKNLIYLGCPYSHPDPAIREVRFHAVNRAAGELLSRGHLVYSPISHSHPIAMENGAGLGWETWMELDLEMLRRCDAMVILDLPGWENSTGIEAEMKEAELWKIPISHISPEVSHG